MLNHMKRKPTSKRTKTSSKRVSLYAIVGIAVILVSFNAYNETFKAAIREEITGYRQQIQNIKSDFNDINPGWIDDEYCTGFGSDINRDNRKRCFLVLSLDYYPPTDNFTDYLNLLSASYKFIPLRPVETVPESVGSETSIRISAMTAPFGKDVSCKFTDASYSSGRSEGYYFVCSFEADYYYFERRNG